MPERKICCPECGGGLAGVYAEATYGRVLLLDQCERCGGVWFDKWELYLLKDGASLVRVDIDSFMSPLLAAKKGPGKCPKCEEELKLFKDPNLPPDASIRRCVRCSGLWLNRGELERRASRRPYVSGVSSGKAKEAGLDALKRLQKELDASSLARPYAPQSAASAFETGDFARDVGLIILETLLRMVFNIH